MAGILGVDPMTVNNWERDRYKPKIYLTPRIVQFLGYNPFSTNGEHIFSEAIRTYRLMHGLSQKSLAKVLRIDPTTLARWESGKATPSKKLGRRLAELINR